MLYRLYISNFTLIDQIKINFNSGFTTVTGQTGAGKSIILGALSLVLGKRAESDLLYDTSKKCVLEAEFKSNSKFVKTFLKMNDFDINESIILRRELLPNGKSRSFINDTPATLKQLSQVGAEVIDIHVQHENLKLGERDYRTFIIDAFGGHLEKTTAYQYQFEKVSILRKLLSNVQSEILKQKQEQDYFEFLFNEFEGANILIGELMEKEEQLKKLEHSEEIKSTLFSLGQMLSNDTNGMAEQAFQAERTVTPLSNYTVELRSLAARVSSMQLEIQDLANEVNRIESDVKLDPENLSIVQERVNLINQLLQKHQVNTESELIAIKDELEGKLAQIHGGDDKVYAIEKELDVEKVQLEKLGAELSELRIACSPKFEKELISNLIQLGMPEAKFEVRCTKTKDLEFLGNEIIDFVFTANKGIALRKVHESASGGELSRILLAIKAIVSSKTKLPTIVFDEIDTGVSGEVANKMGDLMKSISRKIQVLAITHLPQIAAKGNQHFSVYKDHNLEKTLTKIQLLKGDNRVIELAKMLSGDKLSTVAKENARILLDN
tara:strand:+ start:205 stop:1860 length:1656 start_codon:yes stop_codon:yes gene_type:complete